MKAKKDSGRVWVKGCGVCDPHKERPTKKHLQVQKKTLWKRVCRWLYSSKRECILRFSYRREPTL